MERTSRVIAIAILAFIDLKEGRAGPSAPLEQRTESFTIKLHGAVSEVTPLFGPVQEEEWAPGWNPHFLHPAEGAQHEGVVFTTPGPAGRERIWLVTAYDAGNGHVNYVLITPGFTINQINIQVQPDGRGECKAIITYRHSALTPDGNQEVTKLNAHWAEEEREHWEAAINAALANRALHD